MNYAYCYTSTGHKFLPERCSERLGTPPNDVQNAVRKRSEAVRKELELMTGTVIIYIYTCI